MEYEEHKTVASYTSEIFKNPHKLINITCKNIKTYYPECDGIITGSGISGSLLLLPVALRLKLPFAIVRDKKTHSSYKLEGHIKSIKNAVIIDDLIDSGKTMRRLIKNIKNNNINVCGILLYHHSISNSNYISCVKDNFIFGKGTYNVVKSVYR